jgi:oligopeptide/dipeptide ABC transporter ATP-binding protein
MWHVTDGRKFSVNHNIFEVKNLKVIFKMKKTFGKGPAKILKAVDGIDLEIKEGEILSLVGESGSGKTTTGKALLQLVPSESDAMLFDGKPVDKNDRDGMKQFRQKVQMIYQDPYQSLNPRDQILDIVTEPLVVNQLIKTEEERLQRGKEALELAGLNPGEDFFFRYPYELSGGQRQRVVIASAMIMNPRFIVADEPVSMLDASIRTGILRLMMDLKDRISLSYLFITHDLSLAWLISDRIGILYLGKMMEIGGGDAIIHHAVHPYTKALLQVMPKPGQKRQGPREVLEGETPNPTEVIAGCKFYNRCPVAIELCSTVEPEMKQVEPGHFAACHLI